MNWKKDCLTRWQAASRREQRSLMAALAVVAVACLWWLALAPALAVWRTAPAQHVLLDSQFRHMQTLQAQARALQAQAKLDVAESRRALEASLTMLGTAAQVSMQADRLTVTLKGVGADALSQWLARSRQNAHLVPSEVHLARDGAVWTGSVSFSLPVN